MAILNYALAANGGAISVSSILSSAFDKENAHNGNVTYTRWDYAGQSWIGAGGSNTENLTVTFPFPIQLDSVYLYTVTDDFTDNAVPSDTKTFTQYGVKGYQLEYLSLSDVWTPITTISNDFHQKHGHTGLTQVAKAVRFLNLTSPDGYARVAEVQVFGSTDTTAPSVSITSPASGTVVTGTLPIAATASDSFGVASVTFKIGTTTISTDSTAPYSAALDTTAFANGDYNLTATAADGSGNTAVSAPVVITINNLDPNYVPYNDTLIRRFRYFAAAPNFDKITGTIEFQDGGASFNEFSDSPLLQWQLVYQFDLRISLESAQCALMDAFFAGKRKSRSFIFNAKDGVYLDVCHASYDPSHEAHKYWFQTRTIVLTKYPDETTTGTILSDAGGTVLLTDG